MSTGETRLLIDGKLVDSESSATFDNINPATEEVLGVVADGTAADMQAAVAAARRAFDTTDWATNHAFRRDCLLQLQAAIESEQEELRNELVAEVGCPVLLTYGPQLDAPLREALTWPAAMIDEFPWKRSLGAKDAFGMGVQTAREVWKEPIGVVGVIVPWNFPIEITLNKLGPVLAMGNTCVIKPAPDTPWGTTRLGRLIAEQTDIPPGVVNIVASSDHLVGEVLTTSPDVDMIAFTGSTVTGRRIMAAASETLKPVFLELGGKSVNLILDDANFEAAVPSAAGACYHAGQGCAIPTRMLVPNSCYDEAVELAKAAFVGVTYGDPADPSNLMGPVVSKKQHDRVLGYIEKGKQEGARVVTGGGVPSHLPKGFFVEPTLFADVDNSMTIAQEEIFGPVLVIIGFDDDDDAVRIANDSAYGLSGMITSGDLERAKSIAARIRTGTLGINGGIWYGADAPFGGYKQSGIGRQCGMEGLEIFTETKTVGWPRVTGPLDGIRILEVASWMFVPSGGSVLVDWGADVIKVEPMTGDPQRGLITSGLLPGGAGGVNFMVEQPHRGKRSIGLDLAHPDGREALLKLVETSDVFLTNYLPQVRRKLGIDIDDLRARNPNIIIARGSGTGPKGPDAEKGGYDGASFWARGGMGMTMHARSDGWPSGQPTAGFGDVMGGLTTAGAIAAALLKRERTGETSIVDVSLLATAMWQLSPMVIASKLFGFSKIPQGDRTKNPNPGVGTYKTKDERYIALILLQSDKFWADFVTRLGLPDMVDDPRFVDSAARAQNGEACVARLDEAFGAMTLDDVTKAFDGFDGVWSPFQTLDELYDDVQVQANGYLPSITAANGEEVQLVASPAQFDEVAITVERGPEHGEHTELILMDLGYDWDQISALKESGAVL